MSRDESLRRLQTSCGLSKAAASELAKAFEGGVLAHAYDTMLGNGPVPTAMTSARAALVFFVTKEARRMLTDREVQVLLRIDAGTAKRVAREVKAIYEQPLSDLLLQYAWQAEGTAWSEVREGNERRHRVSFQDGRAYEVFIDEIRKRGRLADVTFDDGSMTIIMDKSLREDLKPVAGP